MAEDQNGKVVSEDGVIVEMLEKKGKNCKEIQNILHNGKKFFAVVCEHKDKKNANVAKGANGAAKGAANGAAKGAEGGGALPKKRTPEKVKCCSKTHNVYIGPRGGKYLKINDKFVSVKRLGSKVSIA